MKAPKSPSAVSVSISPRAIQDSPAFRRKRRQRHVVGGAVDDCRLPQPPRPDCRDHAEIGAEPHRVNPVDKAGEGLQSFRPFHLIRLGNFGSR